MRHRQAPWPQGTALDLWMMTTITVMTSSAMKTMMDRAFDALLSQVGFLQACLMCSLFQSGVCVLDWNVFLCHSLIFFTSSTALIELNVLLSLNLPLARKVVSCSYCMYLSTPLGLLSACCQSIVPWTNVEKFATSSKLPMQNACTD